MPPFRSLRNDHVFRHNAPWHARPQTVQEAKVKVFDLSRSEDLAELTRVMERVGMSAAYIHTLEKQFCAETGSWKVFTIWYDLYSEMPAETRTRRDAFLRGEECL